MISYYPSVTIPFFQKRKTGNSPLTRRYFFQSWEDGLWHLLDSNFIKRGVILVPNFYCLDVCNNMEAHGLNVVTYTLNRDFQPDIKELITLIKKHCPTCFIIFHAAGINSSLEEEMSWRKYLPSHTIILHDQVHHLLDPKKVKLESTRDIALDSLRKNSPLPGSFLYLHPHATQIPHPSQRHKKYLFEARLRFLYFRLLLHLAHHLSNRNLVRKAHKIVLQRHDDLIGDSLHGNAGPWWVPILATYLAHDRLTAIKKHQISVYKTLVKPYLSKHLTIPRFINNGQLHAFPLVASSQVSPHLTKELTPINVWAKFPDSSWSSKHQVFFLPLGLHLTLEDQQTIIQAVQRAV